MFVPQGTSQSRAAAGTSASGRLTILTLAGVLALAMLALFSPSGHVAAASDGAIDTDVLNLRDAPSTDAGIITHM